MPWKDKESRPEQGKERKWTAGEKTSLQNKLEKRETIAGVLLLKGCDSEKGRQNDDDDAEKMRTNLTNNNKTFLKKSRDLSSIDCKDSLVWLVLDFTSLVMLEQDSQDERTRLHWEPGRSWAKTCEGEDWIDNSSS